MNNNKSDVGSNPMSPEAWPPAPSVSLPTHHESPPRPFQPISRFAYCLYAVLAAYTLAKFVGLAHRYGIHARQAMWTDSALQSGLMFAGFLILLGWTYRAYSNLSVLGATNLACSPSMAVAYHFVPIAGLIKPFLIYGEIVRATNVTETGRGRMSEWVASAIPALAIWWMTYLFSLVTGILWAAHGQPYLVSPTVLTIVDTIENLAVARAICVMTAQQLNKAFAMGIDRT